MVFRTTKRVGVTMRDLGDTTAYLRRGMREILCLALFFFTFLACEYFFDARMAEFVPSSEVVIYESIVVGASVIGFFVRPFLYYRRPQTIDATSDITDRPPMPILRGVLRRRPAWRAPWRFPMLWAFWCRCSTIW